MKNLQQFDEQRINDLIENNVAENKVLEYKQFLNLEGDSQKKEFLFDVSSFANASGGTIIVGISEENGEPSKVIGIAVDLDAEILKIESSVRDGIAPRIIGMHCYGVLIDNDKSVLVIEIPKSWNAPHQVTFKGADKFYSRSSNGKYKLDVAELKNAFIQSEVLTQRIRDFKRERLNAILAKETYVDLGNFGSIVLHAIPLKAFGLDADQGIELMKLSNSRMKPISAGDTNCEFNFDGIIAKTQIGNAGDEYNGYLQVFRNGIIETANSHLLRPYNGECNLPILSNAAYGVNFEQDIIRAIEECISIYSYLGIAAPIIFFVTLLNVKDYGLEMASHSSFNQAFRNKLDRNILQLPELLMNENKLDVSTALKPIFDTIWNAFGKSGSKSYDENGIWRLPMR